MVGHSPHKPHSFKSPRPSGAACVSVRTSPKTKEDTLAFSWRILINGNRKIRNSEKPCHRSSRFIYWYVTSRATLGLLKTVWAPTILSAKSGCWPFFRNTKKLMRLAIWTMLETRLKHLRSPCVIKLTSCSDTDPLVLKPKHSSKLWERSWNQRAPTLSSARLHFCLRDRGL